jgi:hypothetical protein
MVRRRGCGGPKRSGTSARCATEITLKFAFFAVGSGDSEEHLIFVHPKLAVSPAGRRVGCFLLLERFCCWFFRATCRRPLYAFVPAHGCRSTGGVT